VLNTGSSLIGDVISTGSTGNTLSLVGSGTEDSKPLLMISAFALSTTLIPFSLPCTVPLLLILLLPH
jgi:hypothetical protein